MQERIPSADDYVRAFMRLTLTDAWLAMLRAHANAPNRAVYVTDLSEAAGYKTGDAANLQYGLLAEKLGIL